MLESFKKNKKGILLMICSSLFACIGQLLWKVSAELGFYTMLLGFIFYGVGAFCMIIAYRFGKLSVLQPILSLNYVLAIILGYIFLGESIAVLRIAGVLVIMCGVACVAGGDEE